MAPEFSPQMAQRLELWPVQRLKPYDRNPQQHPREQIEGLKAGIQQLGFNAPILVDGADGIVAGHGRLIAAQELGMAVVPVVVLDHLTPEQRRAYLLADNQMSRLAGSDEKLLGELLNELLADGMELQWIGFSDADLARLNDGLEMDAFQEIGQGLERAEPERQPSLGLQPGDGEDAGPEDSSAESGEVEERHVFSVNLLWDDREVVLAAVRAAKERHGLEGTPEALVQVCKEWLDDRTG
jgi:ParB-like chromosome segregation protein Spo0J